jgi:phage terminase large subunit-like protein
MADQRVAFAGRESEYLRVWENRRVKNADAFCTDKQWELLRDAELRALHAEDDRLVVLGVDAATKNDCAAIVGTTWNSMTKKIEVVHVKVWQPDDHRPLKLTETIGPEIVRLHRQHRIAAVYYDPYQMAAIAEMCSSAGVPMVEFPQTARRIQADKHLHDLIWGGNLAHYGEETLRLHVTSAMTKESERGLRIIKEMSSAKVDAAVALSMSALGAAEVLTQRVSSVELAENPFYFEGTS